MTRKTHDWRAVSGLVHQTEEQARADFTRHLGPPSIALYRKRIKYVLHGYQAQVRVPRQSKEES
jgi:hypothetical protein